jgi:hypothetical protein
VNRVTNTPLGTDLGLLVLSPLNVTGGVDNQSQLTKPEALTPQEPFDVGIVWAIAEMPESVTNAHNAKENLMKITSRSHKDRLNRAPVAVDGGF